MLEKYVEPVTFRRAMQFDDDGFPIPDEGREVTVSCRVQPLVLDEDTGRDRDGTFTELRVFAPAGTSVDSETVVVIRSDEYRVEAPPHDWHQYRRAALSSHRPSVVFVAKRGVG